MLDGLFSGLFNFAGNVLSTSWTNQAQKELAEQEFQYNRQMAEEQYQRDVQMWNMQNAYNSPLMQMRRYAQAGLNPNLIYGQGTNGNSSSAPSFNAPSYHRPAYQPYNLQVGDILQSYLDFRQKEANIDAINSLIQNRNADTGLKFLNMPFYYWRGKNTMLNYDYLNQTMNSRVGTTNLKYNYLRDTYNDRWNLLKHQDDYLQERTRQAAAYGNYLASQIGLNKVRASYYRSMTDWNNAKRDYQLQMNKFGYGKTLAYQHGKAAGIGFGALGDIIGTGLERNWNSFKSWLKGSYNNINKNRTSAFGSFPIYY